MIAENAKNVKNTLHKRFQEFYREEKKKEEENLKQANTHSDQLVDKLNEHMENGTYTEMANFVQSVYKSKQTKRNWDPMNRNA